MNRENMVRVHLQQAILVGYGKEARYAKVLVGEREPVGTEHYAGENLAPVIVIGYVWNYRGHNLAAPTRMRLAASNILAIEDCKMECCPPHRHGKPIEGDPNLKTARQHAVRITKIALFSTAYGASRVQAAARVQEHLERYFHLDSERHGEPHRCSKETGCF